MYKFPYSTSILGLIAVALSTTASAADLTLKCNGVVRRLGGAYERNLRLELEFFRSAGSYKLYQLEDNIRKIVGTGKAEFGKTRILLGNRNWSIDRKTGTVSLSQTEKRTQDFESLTCSSGANDNNMF